MSRWLTNVILRSSLKPFLFPLCSRALSRSACFHSHYDTLKVNPSASLREIKDAYLKLTKQYHPDLHPDDPKCHERFIKLQEAYKILSNPNSRRDYDMKYRNRPSPKYQRPYAYPDFTQRDEWLRQEEMRRESHFRNDSTRENFNQYYSRPHRMTPEELERFYKYKKFVADDKFLYYLFGAVLAAVVMEAMIVTHKRDENLWKTYARGHGQGHANFNINMEEERKRWEKLAVDDDQFRLMTRRREDSGNPYQDNWDERR